MTYLEYEYASDRYPWAGQFDLGFSRNLDCRLQPDARSYRLPMQLFGHDEAKSNLQDGPHKIWYKHFRTMWQGHVRVRCGYWERNQRSVCREM